MVTSKKQVLIVDNATTCAMKIKTLVNIHGAFAKIIHWSDWHYFLQLDTGIKPCLLIIEQTVPAQVTQSILQSYPNTPLFLLVNNQNQEPNWHHKKSITPIVNSLSNYEIIALLEPYWSEDKAINLPSVLILDNNARLTFLLTESLTQANIPSRVSQQLEAVKGIDMLLVNVAELNLRLEQIDKLKRVNSDMGIIAYGEEQDLANVRFVRAAVELQVDLVMTVDAFHRPWLAEFNRIWRQKAEFKDKLLVAQEVEASLSRLLEKSLVMQVLFANSMDGVVSFDEFGQILKFNNGFCDLIGVEPNQLSEANLYTWLPPQAKQDLEGLLLGEHLLQTKTVELQLKHQHQVMIPVSVALNKINFHGEFVYVAVMRNNTSQELQKKILVQQNAQLSYRADQSEKRLERVNESSRKISRKRDAFMVKFSNYLLQDMLLADSDTQSKIENIRDFFAIQHRKIAATPRHYSAEEALTKVINELIAKADRAGVYINTAVASGCQIVVDPEHLDKVLYEVVDNAIKYSHRGGSIKISSKPLSEGFIELKISDQGQGMLEHKQAHLFDLYELNESSCGEFATALPLCKALMVLNKGDISVANHVESGLVVGTEFKLKLPL